MNATRIRRHRAPKRTEVSPCGSVPSYGCTILRNPCGSRCTGIRNGRVHHGEGARSAAGTAPVTPAAGSPRSGPRVVQRRISIVPPSGARHPHGPRGSRFSCSGRCTRPAARRDAVRRGLGGPPTHHARARGRVHVRRDPRPGPRDLAHRERGGPVPVRPVRRGLRGRGCAGEHDTRETEDDLHLAVGCHVRYTWVRSCESSASPSRCSADPRGPVIIRFREGGCAKRGTEASPGGSASREGRSRFPPWLCICVTPRFSDALWFHREWHPPPGSGATTRAPRRTARSGSPRGQPRP
jgi:hypothetical protein